MSESNNHHLGAASRKAARDLEGFFEAVRSYSKKQKEKSMTNINDYLKPGACVPVDSDTTIALVEEIKRLRRECGVLARENAKYEERHKAWEAAVYCVDPAPIMKAVRTSEYGDEALPVPQVRRITDLLDVMNKMREALSYCAKDPWMMPQEAQAQFMVARQTLDAIREKDDE